MVRYKQLAVAKSHIQVWSRAPGRGRIRADTFRSLFGQLGLR